MAGSLALGAGVWAEWIRETAPSYAPFLVGAGAAGLIVSLWLSSHGALPVRVGDAGIAFESPREIKRIAWYEIESLSIKNSALSIKTANETLELPLGAHPKASACIVQEAARRIHDQLEISPAQHEALPRITQNDGELMEADTPQVTGKHCTATNEVITFERDARLCPSCGAIYHRDHVPDDCAHCGTTLRDRALAV